MIVEGKTIPLSAILTGYESAVIGSKTVAASDASLVAGGFTLPFGVLTTGGSGSGTVQLNDVSVVTGTKTMPLSQFLAGIAVANTDPAAFGTLTQAGVAGIIASMGGFASTSTTTNSDLQVGENSSRDGGMFIGGSSSAGLDRTCWQMGMLAFGAVALILVL